jgi:GNAT superfamily N-acetyltransferase
MPDAQPHIVVLTGPAILPALDQVAAVASIVFHDFPYLFEGGVAAERGYMQRYAERPGAAVVLARHEDTIVGAATCLPLAVETDYIREPFLAVGWAPERVCYFGESVLLAPFRGLGLGRQFFTAREAHAASLGLDVCTFFAVQRAPDHPMRPAGYVPHDAFWQRLGYRAMPGMTATMRWRDRNETEVTPKRLSVWARSLSGGSLSGAPLP